MTKYQQWVKEFDQARGWDLCPGTDTLAHLQEELGEVSRCVLALHGYRDAKGEVEHLRDRLGEELADAVTFLVKLAYTYEVDLDMALSANQAKCEARYGQGDGSYNTQKYLEQMVDASGRMLEEYYQRFGQKE